MEQADDLDPAAAIALAWQPRASRPMLETLFVLDRRLGVLVRRAREPMLAQVRLAWWRERLQELPANRPIGEPLLDEIGARWPANAGELIPLVDGWEHLLSEPAFSDEALDGFAEGRGQALAAFARLAGAPDDAGAASAVGRCWGLADQAARSQGEQQAVIRELARREPSIRFTSPRLRGLAVLGGLARRAIDRGEPPMHGRGAALAAIRLGMFGS